MNRREVLSGPRSPRAPAVLYLALTAVLVVLVASIAFSARQPPPPQIAELTPQAQHQITKAPSQLGSVLGSALGGPGGAAGPTSTTTTLPGQGSLAGPGVPAPIQVAAVHHCYGNPPRQIAFDTQSPPCVAYWAGNNGGATSPGVTGDTVTVMAWPVGSSSEDQRVMSDLQTFFNRYFEFYGRSLELIWNAPRPSGDCAAARAGADGIVQSYRPFAATSPSILATMCVRGELARDHVISTGLRAPVPRSAVAANAPYLWDYPMLLDDEEQALGEFVCAQLAGKKAAYAPDPTMRSETRKFGLILFYNDTPYPPNSRSLSTALARCGEKLSADETYETSSDNSSQADTEWTQQAMLAMKQAGVTTVLCFCDNLGGSTTTYVPAAAESQDYHPEWVQMSEFYDFNEDVDIYWTPSDQRLGLMGLTFEPAQVPYPDLTLNMALSAVDPGFQVDNNGLYVWGYQSTYWELLEIASGIQMAGPDLTPFTFARGLQAAHFPNPFSSAMEGAAGFGGGSFAMTEDAAVMWWSNTAPSPYPDEGAGAWCYVDGGERFNLAEANWSAPMELFNGTCESSPPGT